MRDDDICLSFARMIRRHIEKSTGRESLSLSEIINNLKIHQPVQLLLNTIASTLKPKAGMTSFGYIEVESKFLADGIWSISRDWESLIKNENSTKVVALSMTVNKITGSKEVANLLHKCGHMILSSGKSIHVAIDNFDLKQQTATGSKTTQMVSHFNCTPEFLQK